MSCPECPIHGRDELDRIIMCLAEVGYTHPPGQPQHPIAVLVDGICPHGMGAVSVGVHSSVPYDVVARATVIATGDEPKCRECYGIQDHCEH